MQTDNAPIADFRVTAAGSPTIPTQFDASASAPGIDTWLVQFGDGTADLSGNGQPALITHQFTEVGEYDVTLVVSDRARALGSALIHVVVKPDVVIAVLDVTLPTGDVELVADGPVSVTYQIGIVGGVVPYVTTIEPNFPPGALFPIGTTTVKVTVRSADGQTDTAQCVVSVLKRVVVPPPVDPPPVDPPPAVTPSQLAFAAALTDPHLLRAFALRTKLEIDRYVHGRGLYKGSTVAYDAAVDAARWTWTPTGPKGQNPNAEQLRFPLKFRRPLTGESRVLILQDHRWDRGWASEWMELLPDGSKKRLDGWKWTQALGLKNIWGEINLSRIGHFPDVVGVFGFRAYGGAQLPSVKGGAGVVVKIPSSTKTINFGSDSLGPMLGTFEARYDVWTRSILELRMVAGETCTRVSLWIGDETRDPVPILLDAKETSEGFHDEYYGCEYNTSRPLRIGGAMSALARNILMFQDYPDVQPYLTRPLA